MAKNSTILWLLGGAALIWYFSQNKVGPTESSTSQTGGYTPPSATDIQSSIQAAIDKALSGLNIPKGSTPPNVTTKVGDRTAKTGSAPAIYSNEQLSYLTGTKPLTQSQIQSVMSTTIKTTTGAIKQAYNQVGIPVTVVRGPAAVSPSLAKTLNKMYGAGKW